MHFIIGLAIMVVLLAIPATRVVLFILGCLAFIVILLVVLVALLN
jgi:hypothetical protein